MTYYNLDVEGDPGDFVTLEWDDHPNINVTQYQVWRKVKHNGQTSSPELLTTLNRGTTSYVDTEYIITSGYTDDILYYDVRAYYSTEGTYANPDYIDAFGQENYKRAPSTGTNNAVPSEFEISAFPNPFNPSTTLLYRLKENAWVNLTIYDIVGRKIVTLTDQMQAAGEYHLTWSARDASGIQIPSGAYFYRIIAHSDGGVDVFNKVGKLLFVK